MTRTGFPDWDRKEPYADWRKRLDEHAQRIIQEVKDFMTAEEREAAAKRGDEVAREAVAEFFGPRA